MTLIVRDSSIAGAGRGVFTTRPFAPGDTIEICPIILIPREERSFIDRTLLSNYYFMWDNDQPAIVLGFGSIYNHSSNPNAMYEKLLYKGLTIFKCIRPIEKDEEITVFYHLYSGQFDSN